MLSGVCIKNYVKCFHIAHNVTYLIVYNSDELTELSHLKTQLDSYK